MKLPLLSGREVANVFETLGGCERNIKETNRPCWYNS